MAFFVYVGLLLCNYDFLCPQSNTGYGLNNDDAIDIDDLEGSGRGGKEVSKDLESSGSGYGPDDEDSADVVTSDTS